MFSWMFSKPEESVDGESTLKKKKGIGKRIDDFIDGKKDRREFGGSNSGRGGIGDSSRRLRSFSKRAMDGKMSVEKRNEPCPKCGGMKVFNKSRGMQCTKCRHWITDHWIR